MQGQLSGETVVLLMGGGWTDKMRPDAGDLGRSWLGGACFLAYN